MVWSKACPRCNGDLVRVDDQYDPYLSCIQCGHVVYEAGELGRSFVGVSSSDEPSPAEPA